MQIERIGALRAALGESPVWDAPRARLWFMDCRRGLVHQVNIATGESVAFAVPAPTGAFALNADGRLVLALKEDITLFDPAAKTLRMLARIDDSHPNLRLNDGTAMPDGSFVVGTMHVFREAGEAPLGGLYRLDDAGQLARLDRGLGVVNGPTPHPAAHRLYVADSEARKIYRYALDADGMLSNREVFVDTQALDSAPDGCCFDSDGGLWTALVHAGAIARFDADGRLTHKIALPVKHPASLCFGGDHLGDLFVTSISDSGRLLAEGQLDGALLRVRDIGFRGAPVPVCRIDA